MKRKIEYSSTRFYITQKVYKELVASPNSELRIHVIPKKGKHPEGIYELPNKIAREFIESKQGTHNWDNHHDFKQDSIPTTLQDYFIKQKH